MSEETLRRLSGAEQWARIERLLTLLFHLNARILFVDRQFRFRVITVDPDDNKFVDRAIADYILTENAHFEAPRGVGYKRGSPNGGMSD